MRKAYDKKTLKTGKHIEKKEKKKDRIGPKLTILEGILCEE